MPDANTLWNFTALWALHSGLGAPIGSGRLERLFTRLDESNTAAGYRPMAGQIVDTTLVSAPRQRNTEEEKARIKAGEKAAQTWPDKPVRAPEGHR
ncbi:MAG: hypothetical protein RMK90_08315 [Acetobacteraceae bacterium]|nr:hypothetical protein [Acetobacteraceae bacterium]